VLKVLDFGMVRVPQADLHITAEGRPQSAEELWAQLRGLELRRRWTSERGAEWWQRHKLD